MATKNRISVAFQGERGAFSQQAARQLLGEEIDVVPCQRFDEMFQAVASGRVDAAAVPIENTLHGSVHENYDHLLHFELPIVGETNVRIVHNLIAMPGVALKDIKKIYSHPVALNQCLKFLAAHPEMERTTFYDTAGSVKMLAEEKRNDAAAIASSVAAENYGAHILRKSIEDDRQNFTRFFLIRRPGKLKGAMAAAETARMESAKDWKSSLVFTTRNSPGALFRAMSAFALRDLSLSKIESRPLRGKPWEYLFYLDFLGKADDEVSQRAIAHLGETADFLRVLGSYPKGAQSK